MQALLSCPSCRFSMRPRAAFLSVDYGPRCLATRHMAEPPRDRGAAFAAADPERA
jgi:hypothetical protein